VRRRSHRVVSRPLIDRVLGGVTLPPTASVGARFALDSGRGTDGVPVWTAVLGAALAFVLLAGTWTYRSSLQTLLDTPSLYGWNWSVKSGAPALPEIGTTLIPAFATDPAVQSFAAGTVTQADIGGERVDVLAMDQELGTVAPTVLAGRLPKNEDEVLVGTKTLEAADSKIGDVLVLRIGGTSVPMTVVGRGVFPEYGDAGRLGSGAFTTYGGVQRVLPDARKNVFLLRFTEDANRRDTLVRFRDALQPVPTRSSGRPRDLQDLARVRSLPLVMAVILSLLAAATLAHALVTSVRRRRRDLAVLKTVGFRRRQVAIAVGWQATILVGLALAIGLPLGVLGGEWAWDAFAEGLGTEPEATVPVALIVLTVPIAIVFGNLIAAIPAWVAGRTRPAKILRGE
jgi:FtsX-like permease family